MEDGRPPEPGPGTAALAGPTSDLEPIDLLWERLARPLVLGEVLPALCGFPAEHLADLTALHLARTPETGRLLRRLPHIIRDLACNSAVQVETCVNSLRGPVMWSSTLQAWANGASEDTFVCGSPVRDYDLAENRVLAHALLLVSRAGRLAESPATRYFGPASLERIAKASMLAKGYGKHRLLGDVSNRRPSGRDLHKVHHGKRAHEYAPALAVLARRTQPFVARDLAPMCDWRTSAQHRVLALAISGLEDRGVPCGPVEVDDGALVAGPVVSRHWSQGHRGGIAIGDVLIDVPADRSPDGWGESLAELEQRARGRSYCLITRESDVNLALELAMEQGLRRGALT